MKKKWKKMWKKMRKKERCNDDWMVDNNRMRSCSENYYDSYCNLEDVG